MTVNEALSCNIGYTHLIMELFVCFQEMSGNYTVIISLDHVRAKRLYVRTVNKWVQDLDLRGAFVFQRKLILLVLQGHAQNVKVCTMMLILSLH